MAMQAGSTVLADAGKAGLEAAIAVIDIGSNSIRLVIYASGGRYPFPLFNERSNCRLGEGLGEDGMLQADRIQVALAAMARFAGIMKAMGVTTIHAVATAAVRRARNAVEFTGPAEAIIGQPIEVLSQDEEAHFVSQGLTLNIPEATGFVADLGGGSLEVVKLERGVAQHSTSFNFGHLSTVTADDLRNDFDSTPWLAGDSSTRIFGVGGSFRALGLAYIEQTGYPLPVLHGLRIPGDEAANLLSAFCRESPDLSGVPLGRQKTMPVAALIMLGLFRRCGGGRITVSGTSIERLLEVACYLSDMCWTEHEDVRGDLGARRVLGLPVNCVTHKERIWLATAVYHRYVGRKTNKSRPPELGFILSRRRRAEATTIGLGLRFALTFSGGTARDLRKMRMSHDGEVLTLHVDPSCASLVDSHARRRFQQLAQSANLVPQIEGA